MTGAGGGDLRFMKYDLRMGIEPQRRKDAEKEREEAMGIKGQRDRCTLCYMS